MPCFSTVGCRRLQHCSAIIVNTQHLRHTNCFSLHVWLTWLMSMNSNMRSQQMSNDRGRAELVSLSIARRALRAACSCPDPAAEFAKMTSPSSGLFKRHSASSQTSSSSSVRSPSCTTSSSSALPTQRAVASHQGCQSPKFRAFMAEIGLCWYVLLL